MVIRPYRESDRGWVKEVISAEFGGPLQARRGELIDVLALPGLVAEQDGQPVGILTYRREEGACELAFIAALERHRGIGSALLDALRREVADCERIWLVTTNDNLDAVRFYQRRGWEWIAFHRDAITEGRRLKPELPQIGDNGIEIRHELEFEAPRT